MAGASAAPLTDMTVHPALRQDSIVAACSAWSRPGTMLVTRNRGWGAAMGMIVALMIMLVMMGRGEHHRLEQRAVHGRQLGFRAQPIGEPEIGVHGGKTAEMAQHAGPDLGL